MKVGSRLSHIFLSKLKFAYKNNLVYVTHTDTYSESVMQFFQKLQDWGLISHYETRLAKGLGRKIISQGARGVEVRVFLRYFDKKPAVCF